MLEGLVVLLLEGWGARLTWDWRMVDINGVQDGDISLRCGIAVWYGFGDSRECWGLLLPECWMGWEGGGFGALEED